MKKLNYIFGIFLLLISARSASAITSIAVSTGADQGGVGTNASVAVNKPSGTLEDHVLVSCVHAGETVGNAAPIIVPSGWVLIGEEYESVGGNRRVAVYYKVAGASEPSTYTWGATDGGGQTFIAVSLQTLDEVDTSSPVDVAYSTVSHYLDGNGPEANPNPPDITPASNGAYIGTCLAIAGLHVDGYTAPTNYTLGGTVDTIDVSGGNRNVALAYRILPTAAPETIGTWTISPGDPPMDTGNDYSMITFAISPATAGGSSLLLIRRSRSDW